MQIEHPEYIVIMLVLFSIVLITSYIAIKYWAPEEKEKLSRKKSH